MKLYRLIIVCFVFGAIIISCSSAKDISYFQDIDEYTRQQLSAMGDEYPTTIRPDDELAITVSSIDPQASAAFNLPALVSRSQENPQYDYNPSTVNTALQSYLVNKNGEIHFPTLGKIKIAGMTQENAVTYLETRLKEYIKDPIVNIQIVNFKVSVIGEVNNPGAYYFSGRRVSILDALAIAKDITLQGRRDNILLIRDNNGQKEYMRFDITKSEMLTSSGFYLQQNDVIYVEPNKQKQKDSNMGSERQYNMTIITSVISYTLTAISLIVALSK